MIEVIDLEKYKPLFRDSSTFETFVKSLEDALVFDFKPIVYKGEVIGVGLSRAATKDFLFQRMVTNLEQGEDDGD